jgi:hypothetical protein
VNGVINLDSSEQLERDWDGSPYLFPARAGAGHALFFLGDTALAEPRAAWRGRRVLDASGGRIGHVRDVMVEHRSLDEVARASASRDGWGVRARYAVVAIRRAPWRRRHQVLIPAWQLRESDRDLIFDGDAHHLRLTVTARVSSWLGDFS